MLLISRGAIISPTIIHKAVDYWDIEALNFLIAQKVDVNAVDIRGNSAIHIATQIHHIYNGKSRNSIDVLLANGADINQKNALDNVTTPLRIAVQKNNINLRSIS